MESFRTDFASTLVVLANLVVQVPTPGNPHESVDERRQTQAACPAGMNVIFGLLSRQRAQAGSC